MKVDVQPDLFWEDQNRTSNASALAEFFEVREVSQTEALQGTNDPSTLFRGSLSMAQRRLRPYDFCNALRWLPAFRRSCVNPDAYFTDAFDILHNKFKDSLNLYIRPTSPFKEFAGQVFNKWSFEKEINYLKQNKNIRAEEIVCVVSSPKNIYKEYRNVFVDKKFVGSSLYMERDELKVEAGAPNSVVEFAEWVGASRFLSGELDYVIDVGVMEGGRLALVELNGFETSSFYACDLRSIFSAWRKSFDVG